MVNQSKLRAVVSIPLTYIGPLFSDLDLIGRGHNGDSRIGFESNLKVRSQFADRLKWIPSYLETASASGIPCKPFNESIGRELPSSLRRLISLPASKSFEDDQYWYFRSSTPYFSTPLPSGLTGIDVEAIEALSYPTGRSDTQGRLQDLLLVFHLVSNDTPANRSAILSLGLLDNRPARMLFANFFHSPFHDALPTDVKQPGTLTDVWDLKKETDYELDFNWMFSPANKSALVALASEDFEEEISFHNRNIQIRIDGDDRSITRFRTQFAFLVILINMQRERFNLVQENWGEFGEMKVQDLQKKYRELLFLRNNWWWRQISSLDGFQSAYSKWTAALGFEENLIQFEKEVNGLLEFRKAERDDEEKVALQSLNRSVKVLAIFGLIPAWLALLPSYFNGIIATTSGVAALILLVKISPAKFEKFFSYFEGKIQ